MSRPVYSAALVVLPSLGSTEQTLFTVPAGETWVARDIQLTEGTSLGLFSVELVLRRDGAPGAYWSPIRLKGVNLGWLSGEWSGRVVYEEGEVVYGHVLGATADLQISGYRLVA